jgi:hypothetical protein
VGDRQEELSVEDQPEDKCEEKEHESEKGKAEEYGGLFVRFLRIFHSIISFLEKGLPRRPKGAGSPACLELADFFLAQLPHVFSAADQVPVAPYDNGNHIAAHVAFVDFAFLSHLFLLSDFEDVTWQPPDMKNCRDCQAVMPTVGEAGEK